MSRYDFFAVSLVLALVVTGCAEQASPPAAIEGGQSDPAIHVSQPETFPHVIAHEVEYYTSSPAQGRPPDGTLAAGTRVRIRRNTGSYSLVKTVDGLEAYVHGDAVQEADGQAAPAR